MTSSSTDRKADVDAATAGGKSTANNANFGDTADITMKRSSSSSGSAAKSCGLSELLIFVTAIATGTACSILSKTMMELQGEGMTGETEVFQKPIFQTFGMFISMWFGLVMHLVAVAFKLPFPGYDWDQPTAKDKNATRADSETQVLLEIGGAANDDKYGSLTSSPLPPPPPPPLAPQTPKIPVWMYFFLAIPSIFDLAATVLCMMGLQYIDVSIYQLLRGSGIIFVALMKQYVLGDHLYTFQWVGVVWNVVSVFMVGATAILNESPRVNHANDDYVANGTLEKPAGSALLGVVLVMLGAVVQAMQFVFEEKVMTMDVPAPPLLLIGMEGLWGTIICLSIVYPLVYYLPGDDHGSFESPFNTWHMFVENTNIQIAFAMYFFAIFGYNFCAVMVTFMLNSVWHAILDNFRPITVWLTDLFIYYVVTANFGETWTKWSWIQVGGMIVLLYGTAVYNAPNAGSILLDGQWYAFGLDFEKEYEEIEAEAAVAEAEQRKQEEELEHDKEWCDRMEMFQVRKNSSFFSERSPKVSVHTQNLRGPGGTHS